MILQILLWVFGIYYTVGFITLCLVTAAIAENHGDESTPEYNPVVVVVMCMLLWPRVWKLSIVRASRG